ncbi:hypothetical protein ABZ318_25600, partial [Streptomyces sp. NPDC006197]|uniref:hypothetical protein n=1 Tax=Streptomyces sp. NPDC006197 TaxID=3156685 RepID=UPI0033B73B67
MSAIRRDWSARLGKQEAYGTHGARVPQGPSGPHRRPRSGGEGARRRRRSRRSGPPGSVLLIANAINHNDLETGVDEAYAHAVARLD